MAKDKIDLIKTSALKKIFKKQKMKIGNKAIVKFSEFIQGYAENLLNKAIRQAKISGRKIIKNEDIGAS